MENEANWDYNIAGPSPMEIAQQQDENLRLRRERMLSLALDRDLTAEAIVEKAKAFEAYIYG